MKLLPWIELCIFTTCFAQESLLLQQDEIPDKLFSFLGNATADISKQDCSQIFDTAEEIRILNADFDDDDHNVHVLAELLNGFRKSVRIVDDLICDEDAEENESGRETLLVALGKFDLEGKETRKCKWLLIRTKDNLDMIGSVRPKFDSQVFLIDIKGIDFVLYCFIF